MKKKLLVILFSLASLALTSCGGGNDVASSGATAVSAAAPVTSTTATEPKVNGQIDERTGVAPVVAQMTIASTLVGCLNSGTYGGNEGSGPLLTATTNPTLAACIAAMPGIAYGNPWTPMQNGGCLESPNMAGTIGYFSGRGPKISKSAEYLCYNYASYCCSNPSACSGQPAGSQEAVNSFCFMNPTN